MQVFGIAITQLTALLARRSLYCSKHAQGEHSIVHSFPGDDGNIRFERTEHSWVNGKCRYCRASRTILDRGDDLETHAYAFIHTDDIKGRLAELFGGAMQFDVIVGNPPYQMTGGGGGTNDSAIYHHFVRQAMNLEPRFLTMVIPSRWMAGGRGVSDFRSEFLSDRRVRILVDYENAKDIFPTVGIGGGACYFLWDRDNSGACECTFHRNGEQIGPMPRDLGEFDVFVRDPRAVSILRKVLARTAAPFEDLVSGDTPFGLATNFKGYTKYRPPKAGELTLFANLGTSRIRGTMKREVVTKNTELIDAWKLLLPVAGSGRERERNGVDLVLSPPIVAGPQSVCTQTYLVAGPMDSGAAAQSAESYLRTRFARFLVALRKPAQHVFRGMYRWVPQQAWDRTWNDSELYVAYDLNAEEVAFIESIIRPMVPEVAAENE